MIHFGGGYCIQFSDQVAALKALLTEDKSGDLEDAINAYTEEKHGPLNKYMRCRDKPNSFSKKYCDLCEDDEMLMKIKHGILDLFHKIKDYVVNCELKLYRGISGAGELKYQFQIRDCGFVSTSTKRKTASAFSDDFIMTIIVPHGRYKMLFLNEQETEVLLPPGAVFVKCQNSTDTYVYYPDGYNTGSAKQHCEGSPKGLSLRKNTSPKSASPKGFLLSKTKSLELPKSTRKSLSPKRSPVYSLKDRD